MDLEEKGIQKKEQEEDKKNETSPPPLGEEKMRKESSQENVSKENFSQFKIFEVYSPEQMNANKHNKQVDNRAFNERVMLDIGNECLPHPLESANR